MRTLTYPPIESLNLVPAMAKDAQARFGCQRAKAAQICRSDGAEGMDSTAT